MNICPTCRQSQKTSSKFCPHCGTDQTLVSPDKTLGSPDTTIASPTNTYLTVAISPEATIGSANATRLTNTGISLDSNERFIPGTMIANRYRIVGLLGRGGMGEVFRADDLKLGQPVALKFLPPELEADPDRLQRFLSEVRTARQVTHPNVCRVFDIDEVDDDIAKRVVAGDLHPTAPLWGLGESRASAEALAVEQRGMQGCDEIQQGLEAIGMKQERRALRLRPQDLIWEFEADDVLRLEFSLPSGGYATTVVAAIAETGN